MRQPPPTTAITVTDTPGPGPDRDGHGGGGSSREIERSILQDLAWASSSRPAPVPEASPAQSLFSASPLAAPAAPFSPFGPIGARLGESPAASLGLGLGAGLGVGLGSGQGLGTGYGVPAAPSAAPASSDPFSFTLPMWLEPRRDDVLPAPLADWAVAQAGGGLDAGGAALDRSIDLQDIRQLLLDDDDDDHDHGGNVNASQGAAGVFGGWGADDGDAAADGLRVDGLNVRAAPYQPVSATVPVPTPGSGQRGPPPGFR